MMNLNLQFFAHKKGVGSTQERYVIPKSKRLRC